MGEDRLTCRTILTHVIMACSGATQCSLTLHVSMQILACMLLVPRNPSPASSRTISWERGRYVAAHGLG